MIDAKSALDAIYQAMHRVEELPADFRLTDAVILLEQARAKVREWEREANIMEGYERLAAEYGKHPAPPNANSGGLPGERHLL